MVRYNDWEKKLMQWYRRNLYRPFEWGKFDCALAAGNAVLAITGHDPVFCYRGKYSSRFGAARVLASRGNKSLEDAVTRALGKPYNSPLEAKRGDIVLADLNNGPTLLVVTYPFAVGPNDHGLMHVYCDLWRIGWRV